MLGNVDLDARSYRSRPDGSPGGGVRRWLTPLVAVAALALAGYRLSRTVGRYSLDELKAAVSSFPLHRLALAGVCAAASYLRLTGFDFLALRHIGKALPCRQTALASFTALSLGHNIGLAALSSGAVRYRFYARWGLSLADVAQLILFCGITVGRRVERMGGIQPHGDPGVVVPVRPEQELERSARGMGDRHAADQDAHIESRPLLDQPTPHRAERLAPLRQADRRVEIQPTMRIVRSALARAASKAAK